MHLGRIIGHISIGRRAALAHGLRIVETEFVRAGRVGSGAMACAIVEEMGRAADLLVSELVSKVAPALRSSAAFAEIEVAVRQFLRSCDDDLKELNRTARSLRLQERPSQFLKIGRRELAKIAEAVERRLEIERYDFAPQLSEALNPQVRPARGGRPRAEFWDNLWAEIAARLYEGDLKPKSQADVERAMTEWIEGHGRTAAVSTVRSRARKLWQRLAEPLE